MHLHGSIGYDAALAPNGDVWVGQYDLGAPESDPVTWRRIEALERLSFLVIGTERFAELRALLPERPDGAPTCAGCGGNGAFQGQLHGVVCPDCAGLGWRVAG
jgi:hypothetical protein